MEAVGLHYVPQLQLIVCTDHGYCLAPQSLKKHLQRNTHHGYKGPTLHAALEAISELSVRDPRTVEPPVNSLPIPYLPLETENQCRFPACKATKTGLSKHKRTVEIGQGRQYWSRKGQKPRYSKRHTRDPGAVLLYWRSISTLCGSR